MTSTTTTLDRRLSLLTPSGRLTLGNLLGALRPMAAEQVRADCFYGISDLHALTTPQDPAALRDRIREQATLLLAVGLDDSTLFVQSRVPAHSRLGYLLECVATTGELSRMIQFKEKSRAGESTRTSLLTYPALMAADILLYRPARVPVGDDQRQHVELTRDLALRFNSTYGQVFTVPEVTTPPAGARVRDLADPTRKMSKSGDGTGVIYLLDPPDVVRRKIARAVTDSDTGPDAVCAGEGKPGVSNLLDILAACGGSADGITTYGALKRAVTDAVLAELEPLQKRYAEFAADPAYVSGVYDAGAVRCREVTEPVLAAAHAAMGL
jgi:tryptophanyl-tRNA synthetase